MTQRSRLTTLSQGMAIAWAQEGIPVREVARRLTVSHSVIQRLLARFHAINSHPLTQGGQTTSLGHVWKGIIYPSLKRPKCEIYGELYSQDTCLAWVSLMFEYVHWCSCHSRFSFVEIYVFLVILNSSPHGKWAVFRGASSLNLCRNVQR